MIILQYEKYNLSLSLIPVHFYFAKKLLYSQLKNKRFAEIMTEYLIGVDA